MVLIGQQVRIGSVVRYSGLYVENLGSTLIVCSLFSFFLRVFSVGFGLGFMVSLVLGLGCWV